MNELATILKYNYERKNDWSEVAKAVHVYEKFVDLTNKKVDYKDFFEKYCKKYEKEKDIYYKDIYEEGLVQKQTAESELNTYVKTNHVYLKPLLFENSESMYV